VLQEGLFWRIGDGKMVNIWGEKWIPRPTSYKIQSPCQVLSKNAKVAKLIDNQMRDWDRNL
jgi:hypothetical protein